MGGLIKWGGFDFLSDLEYFVSDLEYPYLFLPSGKRTAR